MNDSMVAMAVSLKLNGNLIDPDIDNIIKGHIAAMDTDSGAFRKFLIETLAPEVSKDLILGNYNLISGFINQFLVDGDTVFPDYQIRDNLTNLNKLALYQRQTKVRLTGFDVYGLDFKEKYASYMKFNYPLSCSMVNYQALDNLNRFTFDACLKFLFDSCRVFTIEVHPIARKQIINMFSFRELRIAFGDEQYNRFLDALLNSKASDDYINPHKIRTCLARQVDDIFHRRVMSTFPVLLLSEIAFPGIENFNILLSDQIPQLQLGLNNPRYSDLPIIQSVMFRINPEYDKNIMKTVGFLDVVNVSNVTLTTGHPKLINGRLTSKQFEHECWSLSASIIASIDDMLTLSPTSLPRYTSILGSFGGRVNVNILPHSINRNTLRDHLKAIVNEQPNPILNFSSIIRMAYGLDAIQRAAFISMFMDMYLVSFNVQRHISERENDSYKIDNGCIISLYLSQYLAPQVVEGVYSSNFDSLKACINYGLVSVKAFPASGVDLEPSDMPSIIFIGCREISVNLSFEQIYTLYAAKLLDQLMVYRNNDFFYTDIIPGSFKDRLRSYLDSYFPGFLKPPVINPFDLVSQPFIPKPYYNNTVFPDRNVLLPDIKTFN